MSPERLAAFLDEERTVTCATFGPRGFPHLMPLWYVVRDRDVWAWTYAKSQKVRNLERDRRCTLMFEAGESYDELRGVMLKCECVLHRSLDAVTALGEDIARRYGGGALDDDARAAIAAQARKRVAMQFGVRETATWDHGKL